MKNTNQSDIVLAIGAKKIHDTFDKIAPLAKKSNKTLLCLTPDMNMDLSDREIYSFRNAVLLIEDIDLYPKILE